MYFVNRACFVFILLVAGCVTQKKVTATAWPSTPDEHRRALAHAVPTNVPFGSVYEMRVYIVQAGDTLAKILRQFHLTAEELASLNGYNSPDLANLRHLRVGQRLLVNRRISQ